MKAAQAIRKRIVNRGPDSLWSFDDFVGLPSQAVAKSLSRLAKDGFLQRVRKGLYYYPKQTVLGSSQPSSSALLGKIIAHSGYGAVFSGGTASFQNLGVTTQVPAQYTLLASIAPRTIRIGKMKARIQRRNLQHLTGASQHDVWILDSIRNLRHVPDSTPDEALTKIMSDLRGSRSSLKKLLRFAQGEPPRVRAVMGAMAEHIGYRGMELGRLRKSLNPLTKFRVGISRVLPNALAWNIV